MPAQEPAFFAGMHAIRYEENPGYFHFVFPCNQVVGATTQTETPGTPRSVQPALCWPVRMVRSATVDGKTETAPYVDGLWQVSATTVEFIPIGPNGASQKQEFAASQTTFQHDVGKPFAVLGAKDLGYQFVFSFRTVCEGCKQGTPPPDPNKGAQLDAEFTALSDSLKEFETVSKHIKELAAQTRVGVTPANQPTAKDIPEAMGLYSDLNNRFAEKCPVPAKSCVLSYAKYQACKGGSSAADCGDPPTCSAFCALTPEEFHGFKAGICITKIQDSASLTPDWSEVVKKKEAEKAAALTPQINSAGDQSRPPASPTGVVAPKENTCSVMDGYSFAMMAHAHQGVAAGMDGMGGNTGGVMGGMLGADGAGPAPVVKAAAPKKIVVSAGVIAGNKIGGATPVYPVAAKAAGIQGTVVLQAVISKQGDIENVSVVSGPALLQQAALDAVRTWRYRPYNLNGEPVEVFTQVNVIFTLGVAPPTTPAAPAQDAPTP
jgi:TonB family protein